MAVGVSMKLMMELEMEFVMEEGRFFISEIRLDMRFDRTFDDELIEDGVDIMRDVRLFDTSDEWGILFISSIKFLISVSWSCISSSMEDDDEFCFIFGAVDRTIDGRGLENFVETISEYLDGIKDGVVARVVYNSYCVKTSIKVGMMISMI